ncbi:MAG: hypothetical protein PHC66_04295 [Candidatus Nanoarchaeia archaeon]|nr:hypothetical protein [Candidatus Nanoarchaeia archaeon]MDD5239366.1 hypothetical protein [Candidatus Nanoarchaeia archaeon]
MLHEKTFEKLCKLKAIEYYKMYAGLSYDESKIKSCSTAISKLSKSILDSREEVPERIKYWLIDNAASRDVEKYFMKQIKIRSKFRCGNVDYASWRSWLPSSKPEERKKVFDYFVKESKKLSPLIQKWFNVYSDSYRRYDCDVLGSYFDTQKIKMNSLVRLLKTLGREGRHAFDSGEIESVVGHPLKYYDEYYYLGSKLRLGVQLKLDTLPSIKKIFSDMGFDFDKVRIDSANRKKKFGYGYCISPNPPEDVRVVYRSVGGLKETEVVYHEFGHAMQGISMTGSFFKKEVIGSSINEIFSMFFESLISNRQYLGEKGIANPDEIVHREKLANKLFFAGYAANSFLNLKFLSGGIKFNEMDETYGELLKKYTGIETPGGYWKLHHILSEFLIYSPSYMISHVRAGGLNKLMTAKFGDWWKSKEAGNHLKRIMADAEDIKLSEFSSI